MRRCLLALALAVLSTAALAQTYPNKPVRLIVAYPPGGTSDLVGRVLAQEMTKRFGQNFVVENKTGAGGQIGTDAVAKAEPDGYTILIAASGPISYLPALAAQMPYDIRKDFATVGNIVTVPNLMIVNAGSSVKSLNDLAVLARKKPGAVHFGSAGVGSSGHIAGELFKLLTETSMVHVPYRGSGPAIVGLLAGEIEVMFENLPSALTQVRSGKLRGIAVLSAKRSPSAPEFPATAELGMPELTIASSTGLLVPAGTPREAITALESGLKAVAVSPEAAQKFMALGADIDFMDAVRYRAYIEEEIVRWAKVGQRAQITLK
jgi:tripartite-type tricarboxylate transporter receptor subunit TctC